MTVSSDGPALLDVNVPMYAAGQPHPYKEACVWVMTEVTEGRLATAINTETIQEILYRYGALQQWPTAIDMATSLLDIVPTMYPILPADVRLAITLARQYAAQGVRARDLFHAAVMRNNGLTAIISIDAHFDRIAGIARLDPQRMFAAARKP